MKVYLVRHAQITTSPDIVQGVDDPIIYSDTTTEKASQARELIGVPDIVYCSELLRAKQTLALIYPETRKARFTPLLNEYVRPSRFIGGTRADLVRFWQEHDKDKLTPTWRPEDGESYLECASRAQAFYERLLRDKASGAEKVAVIGHGTHFRHLACAFSGVAWKDQPQIVTDLLRTFAWSNLEVKAFDI